MAIPVPPSSSLPAPLSYEDILGQQLSGYAAAIGVDDLAVGSANTSFFQIASLMVARASGDIFQILRDKSLDRATGPALQNLALEYGVPPIGAKVSTGFITVIDLSFQKIATKVYAGANPPIAGSNTIFVSDASLFPATGSIYIGRGSVNVEGPLAYSAKTQVGSFWSITLSAVTTKFHNLSESVILAQGGVRTVPANTIVVSPGIGTTANIQYSVVQSGIILDGETTVTNIPITALLPGASGNVPAGAISQFAGNPPGLSNASVTNPLALTTGADTENDNQLRVRIKNALASTGLGTVIAIKSALQGVQDPTSAATITSTDILNSSANTIVFIDDGSGYEGIHSGVAIETIINSALGGERFFQLVTGGKQTSVTKALLQTVASEPFDLSGGEVLSVVVGNVTYEHTFDPADFANPGSATAYEICASLNADTLLNYESVTAGGGVFVVIRPKDEVTNIIQLTTPASSLVTDANTALQFPSQKAETLRLYKNGLLLIQDGTTASIFTQPQGLWSPTLADGETLSLSVDGTDPITYTLTNADFVAEGTYTTLSYSNSLQSWVNVLNDKVTGITAAIVGSTIELTSNRGAINKAKIAVVNTVTNPSSLISKGVISNNDLSSTGVKSDYILDRNTAQIELATALVEKDVLSAGTLITQANIKAGSVPSGSVTLASDAHVWISIDTDAVVIPTIQSGSSLTVSTVSPDIVRYTSNSVSAFANVIPGDYVIIWSTEIPLSDRLEGRVHAATGSVLDIRITAAEYALATPIVDAAFIQGFVVVRTDNVPQKFRVQAGTKTLDVVVDELQAQTNGLTFGVFNNTNITVVTNTLDTAGQITIATADSFGALLGFVGGANSVSQEALVAFYETESTTAELPLFFHSAISADSYADPIDTYLTNFSSVLSLAQFDPNELINFLNPYGVTPSASGGPSSSLLLSAANFALLASSTITNTGASVITGDVGLDPGSAVTSGGWTVIGTIHINDSAAINAQADALAAYTTLTTAGGYVTIPSALDSQTLTAGYYEFASGAATLALSGNGTLTLSGNATDVFVIKTASTLGTGAGGIPTITLTGGALASNVYWVVGSSATINIGVTSAGAVFEGNVIAQASITNTQGGTVNGSLIALTAAVTLSAATIVNAIPASPSGGVLTLISGSGDPTISFSAFAVPNQFFTVTAANATAGDTYTNNGYTFTVTATISGGTILTTAGSGTPTLSGILTKASGTGDATIAFSSFVIAINPFQFIVTSANASAGAVYMNNGQFFTVTDTIILGTTLTTTSAGLINDEQPSKETVQMSALSGTAVTILPEYPNVRRLRVADRFYVANPLDFGYNDTIVAIVDNNAIGGTYTLPLYRRAIVNSIWPANNFSFNAYDVDAGATASFATNFTGFDFSNFKVLMQPKFVLQGTNTQTALLFRSALWGRSGEMINVSYVYPTSANQPIDSTVIVTDTDNVDIRISLISGNPISSTISSSTQWNVAVTPNTPTAGIDQVTFNYAGQYTYTLPGVFHQYTFTVTAANATTGAMYTNNGQTFTVSTTIVAGTTLVAISSGGAPTPSGTLTKISGTGDATIAFSAFVSSGSNATAGAVYSNNGQLFTATTTIAAGTTLVTTGSNSAPTASGTLTLVSGTGDLTIPFTAFTFLGFGTAPSLTLSGGEYVTILPSTGFNVENTGTFRVSTEAGFTPTSTSFSIQVPTGTATAQSGVVTGILNGISFYTATPTTAAAINTYVNANLSQYFTTTIVDDGGMTGSGILTLSSFEDSGFLTPFYFLRDGINWIASSNITGSPQFTLKEPLTYFSDTGYNFFTSGDEVRLIPTTMDQVQRLWSILAVTGFTTVGTIEVVERGTKLQLATNILGSVGSIQIVGGNGNGYSVPVLTSGALLGNDKMVVSANSIASQAMASGQWFRLQAQNYQTKNTGISNNTSVTVLSNSPIFGESTVTLLNQEPGQLYFGGPRKNIRVAGNTFRIEKQGLLACLSWNGVGTSPGFSSAVDFNDFGSWTVDVSASGTYTVVPSVSPPPPPPSPLASAVTYGILAASAITNSVGTSTVNGDLGEYPGSTVTGSFIVTGATNLGNAAANTAQNDALSAFTSMQTLGLAGTTIPSALDSQILTPGAYKFASGAATLATSGAGTLTFNGAGTYIIYTASTLTTGAGGVPTMTLTGGALASDIYWIIGSSATINSGSAGIFNGNIVAQASITDTMGGTVNGSLIALTGAVTLSAAATVSASSSPPAPPLPLGNANFAALSIGDLITISGLTNPGNNGTFFVTGVSSDGLSFSVSNSLSVAETGTVILAGAFSSTSSVSEGDTLILSSPFAPLNQGQYRVIRRFNDSVWYENTNAVEEEITLTTNAISTGFDATTVFNISVDGGIETISWDGTTGSPPFLGLALPGDVITFSTGFESEYTFIVSSANATAGATYTNNGQTFTVVDTISAETALVCTGTGDPAPSGILTKTAGTGDATITFSAFAVTPTNQGSFTVVSSGPSQQQIVQLIMPAGIAFVSSGPGAYFEIWNGGNANQYYVWYNVSGGNTDPAPVGFTGIEVSITNTDPASGIGSIAVKTNAALSALVDMTSSVSGNVVTVTADNAATTNIPLNVSMPASFSFVVTQMGQEPFLSVINPSAMAQVGISSVAFSIDRPQILFYPYEATVPGDKLVVNGSVLGSGNAGSYSVLQVLSPNTVIVSGAISQQYGTNLAGNFSSLSIEEGVKYTGYKQVAYITAQPGTSNFNNIVFNTSAQYEKINLSGDIAMVSLGKLNFPTTIRIGIDSYSYDTGLIGEANRVTYGDPRDQITYPGVSAAGSNIFIREPLLRRVKIALAIRTNIGVSFAQITSQIQSSVYSLIQSNPLGQSIDLSSIVETVRLIPGVTSVVLTSPEYTVSNDEIQLVTGEKAIIVNQITDISVALIGS